MNRALRIGVAAAFLIAAGCQDDEETAFPFGLEPLETNLVAPLPASAMSEALATTAARTSGVNIHGRGYIAVAPSAVWRATKDPLAMAATCGENRVRVTPDTEPQYEYSFGLHYTVERILTVEWDELWRYGLVREDPAMAIIRYQKVFGSDLIALLEGSIQVHATAHPNWTEVQFIEHVDAVGASAGDVMSAMNHRYSVLRALSHQMPTPECP